jgi:hypothetical protein
VLIRLGEGQSFKNLKLYGKRLKGTWAANEIAKGVAKIATIRTVERFNCYGSRFNTVIAKSQLARGQRRGLASIHSGVMQLATSRTELMNSVLR